MENIEVKYVYEKTDLGWGWQVVITKDGEKFAPFYPFGDLKVVKEFVNYNLDILLEKLEDEENNYGLAFYACGYNGDAQQDFWKYWRDKGLSVF